MNRDHSTSPIGVTQEMVAPLHADDLETGLA